MAGAFLLVRVFPPRFFFWGAGGVNKHRCPSWLTWLKNRERFLVYLVLQSTTRAIYFPKKDTYANKWWVAGAFSFCVCFSFFFGRGFFDVWRTLASRD